MLACGVVRVKSIAPGKSAAVDGRIRKHDVLFSFNGSRVGSLGYTKVCVCVFVCKDACVRVRSCKVCEPLGVVLCAILSGFLNRRGRNPFKIYIYIYIYILNMYIYIYSTGSRTPECGSRRFG